MEYNFLKIACLNYQILVHVPFFLFILLKFQPIRTYLPNTMFVDLKVK